MEVRLPGLAIIIVGVSGPGVLFTLSHARVRCDYIRRVIIMKKFLAILFVCLLTICAFAGDKTITIISKTNMNGQTLAPGTYKVTCDIKGSTAEVKFLRGNKTVATATGNVVETKDVPVYNAVVNQANADGSNSMIEIQFAKEKQVIRLNADQTAVGK